MPNFSFRGPRELSTGLHLQQKDQDEIIWPIVNVARCVTRRGDRRRTPLNFCTENIEPLSKNGHDRVQASNPSAKL